jgi:hypothetical protein
MAIQTMANGNDQRSEINFSIPDILSHYYDQQYGFLNQNPRQTLTEDQVMPLMDYSFTVPNPHLAKPSENSLRLQCEICKRIFNTRMRFNRHQNIHRRPYKCLELNCHMAFASNNDLIRHKRSVHALASTTEIILCPFPYCPFSRGGFTRRDNFLRHLRRAHPSEDGHSEQAPQAKLLLGEDSDQGITDQEEDLEQQESRRVDDRERSEDEARCTLEREMAVFPNVMIPSISPQSTKVSLVCYYSNSH